MDQITNYWLLQAHGGMTSLGKREQDFSIRFCYDMNSSVNAYFLMTTYTFTSEVSDVPSYVAGVSQLARCNATVKCNVSFYTVKCAGRTKRHVTGK